MSPKEIQKRNERADQLRVLQVNPTTFFVESSEGKIAYRVNFSDEDFGCSCGDYARGLKTDPNFRCKHLLALLNCDTGQMLKTDYLEKKKPRLDERFITTVEGQDFVKYPGLLDLGHQKGILKIEVEALQFPRKDNENVAICKATIMSKSGEIFSDWGDANPGNCTAKVAKHLLRMASTRAIARALRSFTNIGMTCLEELGDFRDVEQGKPVKQSKKISPKESNGNGAKSDAGSKTESSNGKEAKPQSKEPEDQSKTPPVTEAKKEETTAETSRPEESSVPSMSEAQHRAVMNLSRRRGISVEDVEKMSHEKYQVSLEDLSSKQAAEFIRQLQQAA